MSFEKLIIRNCSSLPTLDEEVNPPETANGTAPKCGKALIFKRTLTSPVEV